MTKAEYSVRKVSQHLLAEIKQSLKSLEGWGSIEIFVQNGEVTQINTRKIKKVSKNGVNGKH